VVHFRYGSSVPFPQLPTPPRGDAVEFMFRREQSNSTDGTFTHVEVSFTGAGRISGGVGAGRSILSATRLALSVLDKPPDTIDSWEHWNDGCV